MKNKSILLSGAIWFIWTGCTTTTQSQYCIHVAEAVECPTLEEVNETTLPAEDCGGTHVHATDFATRNESVSIWEDDSGLDNQYDACCYTTSYVAQVGVDCAD